jgi:hypothetical protein
MGLRDGVGKVEGGRRYLGGLEGDGRRGVLGEEGREGKRTDSIINRMRI